MLKETHVQAWMVVHALINGYGRTQPGCRDDLLAFLFQLSYCKVKTSELLGCCCLVRPKRGSGGPEVEEIVTKAKIDSFG